MNRTAPRAPARPAAPHYWQLGIGLAILALSIHIHAGIREITATSSRLPLWDMAEHGLSGVRLAAQAQALHPIAFLKEVNRMGMWPPLFPLLEAPGFLLLGNDYDVAEGFVGMIFVLGVLAAYTAGLSLGGLRGIMTGAVAAALFASSPLVHLFSGIVMLEILGALLLLLALAAHLRFERSGDPKWASLAAVLTLLLFFCKYNYGILWMLSLAVLGMTRVPGGLGGWRDRIHRLASARFFRRPLGLALLIYLLFLAAILVTGGWKWRVAGHTISIRSLGNPFLLLFWVLALGFLVRPRRHLRFLRDWAIRLPLLYQRLCTIVLAPIFLWLLVPSHMKGFFNFVENRTSGLSLLRADGLLYYPRSFLADYSPSRTVGLLVLAGALVAVILFRSLPRNARIIPIALLVGLAATTVHRYKEPRFFFTVAPLCWLSCGLAVAEIGERMTAWRKGWMRLALAVSVSLAAIGFAIVRGFNGGDARLRFDGLTAPAGVRSVLDAIAEESFASKGAVLLGSWNRLSPALVEWKCWILKPGDATPKIPRSPRMLSRRLEAGPLLERISRSPEVERVLVLDLAPGSPAWNEEFARENDWLPAVQAALDRDPRFSNENEHRFGDTGYHLRVYRKRS